MTGRDQRSADAKRWRAWYRTGRWRKRRVMQLRAEPLCRFCSGRGRTTAATVCDHVTPHKGDADRFWSGPFQSLCASCHSAAKQQEERRGFSTEIGIDGFPVDPRHPCHGG